MLWSASKLPTPDMPTRTMALASKGAACRACLSECLAIAEASGFKDTFQAFTCAAVQLDELSRLTESFARLPGALQSAVFSRLLSACAYASAEVTDLAGAHGDDFLACCVVCRDYQRACSKLAAMVRR